MNHSVLHAMNYRCFSVIWRVDKKTGLLSQFVSSGEFVKIGCVSDFMHNRIKRLSFLFCFFLREKLNTFLNLATCKSDKHLPPELM